MSDRRKALTPEVSTQWAQMVHALYLDALMTQADWDAGAIAFHGGTSLRLSWHSPRYSEDLDFLLSRQVTDLQKVMTRVERRLGETVRQVDPLFKVEIRDKTRDPDRMPAYMISLTHPAWVGAAKIKAEFWRTPESYLANYPTQMRTPQVRAAAVAGWEAPTDLMSVASTPVPAATLQTAYADKLVAFATRPHLKWRDLWDLFWIGTQTQFELDMDAVCEQFQHNIKAYTPRDGLAPHEALASFLARDPAEVVALADPDLKNWLPPALWKRMQGPGVEEIVAYVRGAIADVSTHLARDDDVDADCKGNPPRERG